MFDSAIRFQSMPFHSNSIPNFGVALAVFSLSWNSFVHNKKLSCEMNHTLPAGRSVGRPVCMCVFSHLPIIRNVPTMIECVCVYGFFSRCLFCSLIIGIMRQSYVRITIGHNMCTCFCFCSCWTHALVIASCSQYNSRIREKNSKRNESIFVIPCVLQFDCSM